MTVLYDTIGRGYGALRRPDQRIKRRLFDALGDASSVINVGAGAGSYEPNDRPVVAVDRSLTMIQQRGRKAAPVIQARAESLPFSDGTFAAAMAILTIHHWSNLSFGLRELRRVARERVVILTRDPAASSFWLTEYFPELIEVDQQTFPSMATLEQELGPIDVYTLPIPHDCRDGFTGAYWRRPAAYLDRRIRSAMSTFTKLNRLQPGLDRLRQDLSSGAWQKKYGGVLKQAEMPLGYRLVVSASQ